MNYSELENQIKDITNIEERLNCVLSYHINNKSNPEYSDTVYTLVKNLPKKFFPDKFKDVDFTYWFLKYNAQCLFDLEKKSEKFQNDFFLADDCVQNIKDEIEKINKEALVARETIRTKEVNTLSPYVIKGKGRAYLFDESNYNTIEVKRIHEGYYKRYPTEHAGTVFLSPEVKAYYRHKLLKEYLEGLLNHTSNDGYKKKVWFKVGVLFADGTIYNILNAEKLSAPKIAEKLGHKEYSKHISGTIGNYGGANANKNIYSSIHRLEQIIDHCEFNNISLCNKFIEKTEKAKDKQPN